MAIVSAPAAMTVTTEERTKQAVIDTPKGGPYRLIIQREKRTFDASNNQIGEVVSVSPIILLASGIETESITVGGVTLTVLQIEGFLAAYFDQKATAIEAP